MERLPESCTDVQASLPLFVGEDLEPAALDAVARHVGGCAACRALEGRARSARELLLGLGREHAHAAPPAPGLWPGIRGQLVTGGLLAGAAPLAGPGREAVERELTASRPGRVLSGPVSGRAWHRAHLGRASAAAAAALLAALGLLLSGEPGSERSGSPGSVDALVGVPPAAGDASLRGPGGPGEIGAGNATAVHLPAVAPEPQPAFEGALRPAGLEDPSLMHRALLLSPQGGGASGQPNALAGQRWSLGPRKKVH